MTSEVETDLIIESKDASSVTWEMKIAKACTDHLQSHYPGHLWAVNVNSIGGTINIFNLAISSIYGYLLYMTTVENDRKLACVTKAGGELLERGGLPKRWNGEKSKFIEGMPDNKQPNNRKSTTNIITH